MENKHHSISVVVPVYNSVQTLDELLKGIVDHVKPISGFFEIILVDDYSKQPTREKLIEIKNKYPENVKVIRLSKNFGQNNATLCGIDHAKGDWVVTIDDDLDFRPADIPLLLQKAIEDDLDVVYGVFKKSSGVSLRSMGRKALFFVLNKFENGFSIGSSFRVISRNVVERINHHNQDHLFINQIISWYTQDIGHVKLEKHTGPKTRSGYSIGSLISIGFRLMFYYTSLPLKLIIYFSFLTALVSLIFGIYYLIQKLTVGSMAGYSSMIVSLFVATSIIMLGIGVLALFVNRIYNSRIKRPNYSIKRIK